MVGSFQDRASLPFCARALPPHLASFPHDWTVRAGNRCRRSRKCEVRGPSATRSHSHGRSYISTVPLVRNHRSGNDVPTPQPLRHTPRTALRTFVATHTDVDARHAMRHMFHPCAYSLRETCKARGGICIESSTNRARPGDVRRTEHRDKNVTIRLLTKALSLDALLPLPSGPLARRTAPSAHGHSVRHWGQPAAPLPAAPRGRRRSTRHRPRG